MRVEHSSLQAFCVQGGNNDLLFDSKSGQLWMRSIAPCPCTQTFSPALRAFLRISLHRKGCNVFKDGDNFTPTVSRLAGSLPVKSMIASGDLQLTTGWVVVADVFPARRQVSYLW